MTHSPTLTEVSHQVGRWPVERSSGMTCLSSCKRQENEVTASTFKFPNKMFLSSPDLLYVMRKLFWSCQINMTSFGHKRDLLKADYPVLCSFYDDYVYNNEEMTEFLSSNGVLTREYSLSDLTAELNMTSVQQKSFKGQLLAYATNNLVRIRAYLGSPYVSTFETDEVTKHH